MSGDSIKEKDVEGSPQVQPTGEPEDIIGEVRDVKNADAALDFLRSEGNVRPMTPADEKKLLRKIDWMVMPLVYFPCPLNRCATIAGYVLIGSRCKFRCGVVTVSNT